MSRVVVGGFDDMFRLGLGDILTSDQIRFLPAGEDVGRVLNAALPDVVMLDSASPATAALVRTITHHFPTVRVITCSARTTTMQVYPAFHGGESFTAPLVPIEIGRQIHT